jgi:hypothetical protein
MRVGLIVEKWLHYYYPFVERRLPQRHGERPRSGEGNTLAFRRAFEPVTDFYRPRGGVATSRAPARACRRSTPDDIMISRSSL